MKYLQLGKIVKRPADGRRCLVAGWGQTENNETSDVLKGGHVAVISRQKCNSCDYYNHNPSITRDMICAGTFGKRNDSSCYVSMTNACSFYFFVHIFNHIFDLAAGGFRRTTAVLRNVGWSHFFWISWVHDKTCGLLVSLKETTKVDQKNNEVIWNQKSVKSSRTS